MLLETWNSWENVRAVRNKLLEDTDMKKLLPEGEEYDAWEAYRQELRDLPQKYDGKEPHTVPHPDSPEDTENKARQAAEENN